MKEGPTAAGVILVADDDVDFRQILVKRASRLGFTVVEAGNGPEAIEAVRRRAFDVIVVDLYMPGATGLQVVEQAHRTDANTQAIVLTASATVETAVEALRAGVYDYMTKPLDSMAAFELSLTRALEHRHLILENARLFDEVQRLAVTDPLTGLFNRHKLNEALDLEVERAGRYGRPLSLIMLDMDQMKKINDTYGHPAGDEVLRRVADTIRKVVRKVDLPTRYGGDEFLVVLPEAGTEEAGSIAERICAEVRSGEYHGISVSVSAGVAQWRPSHTGIEDFVFEADRALYERKRA